VLFALVTVRITVVTTTLAKPWTLGAMVDVFARVAPGRPLAHIGNVNTQLAIHTRTLHTGTITVLIVVSPIIVLV